MFLWSFAVGVLHTQSPACLGNWSIRFLSVPSGLVPVSAIPVVSFQSRADGLAHDVRLADWFKSCGPPLRSISRMEPSTERTFFSASVALAVGHDANVA